MLREKSKKPISMIIVIAMILSFIPTSIFADGFDNQVVQSNGSLGTRYGVEVRPENNDTVIMEKSINQVGKDTFDITLKVSTTEEVTETFISPDAAVVIVIDNSGSMYENNGYRINAAKNAAKTFVDNFVKDNLGASRKMAVVQFDSNAKRILNWTEANQSSGVSSVKNAINNMTIDSNSENRGTNIEGGLRIANNLLSDVRNIDNLFVVLLTDGVPTFYVSDNLNQTVLNSKESMPGTSGGRTYASWNDYKDIPGIANSIKSEANNNAKLYTINFGATETVNGQPVNNWLSSFATQNISADNVSQLTTAFEIISNNIKKQMQAWVITDPMGEFIQFDEEANRNLNVNYDTASKAVLTFDRDKKLLTWDLRNETNTTRVSTKTEGNKTRTTYTLTYRVKLNTSHPDFKEGVSYDTNGITTLSYVLATTENGVTILGDVKDANFVVPKVQGTIPSYPYIVEYYKADKTSKREDNTYAKYDKVDTKNGNPAKLHSVVSAEETDENYAHKYKNDNYEFATGNTTLKITANNNIIKLYYNPILADVSVNHVVTTTTYKADGTVEVKTDAPIIQKEFNLYKGDSYTAKLLGEEYALVEKESDKYENVILKEGLNTINLRYTREIDERAEASLKVNHNYTVKTWTIKDGKYVLVESSFSGKPDETNNLRATSQQTITPKLKDDFKVVSISPNVDANSNGNYVVTLNEGENEYTINYEKIIDNRREADITVIHHYKTIKVDGITETTEEDDAVKAYVGEDFTAAAKPNGFTQTTPDAQLKQVVKESGNTIHIYYEKDERVDATITVIHEYEVTEYKLVTIIKDGIETVEPQWVTTGSGIVTENVKGDFYIGSKYTPVQITNPHFDDYNYEYVGGATGEQILSNETNVFYIYYNVILKDSLEDAQLRVKHIYETWKTYVNDDGEIVRNEITIDESDEDAIIKGKVGQTVNIDVKEKDAYERYDENKTFLMLSGDSEIELRYRKYEDELGEKVAIEVQPYYVTYTKITNENNETEIIESTETDTSKTYKDFYAGQYFSADLGEFYKEGFEFNEELTLAANAYEKVKLEETNDVIKLYFSKEEDKRDKAELVVNHNYKFTTYEIIDGSRVANVQAGTIIEGIVDTFYAGDIYTAVVNESQFGDLELEFVEAVPGLELKLVKGINTINLYYEGEIDLTIPATIMVNHYYKTIDLNGTVTEEEVLGTAANSYAGVQFTATPNLRGTETLDTPFAVQNPDDLTIVLQENENVINIFYERVIDSRKATTIKVVHEYYAYDTRIDPDKANRISEGKFEEIISTVDQGAWIGNTFTAALRTAVGEDENTVYYALDPADQLRSIVVGEVENEIILTYSRDYASPEPPVEPEPENPEPPVQPEPENPEPTEPSIPETPIPSEPDDSEIIEDEEIPGGAVEIEDDKEDLSSDDIIIEDEEIPGGAVELPDTGGLPSDIFYGLGALAMLAGVFCKFKRKEDNEEI